MIRLWSVRACLALLLGAFWPASSASAQSADAIPPEVTQQIEQLQAYADSRAHQQMILNVIRVIEQGSYDGCREIEVKGYVDRQLGALPEFTDQVAYPVAGNWRERWLVNRCGTDRLFNLYFVAQANGPPNAFRTLPGVTQSPPPLQGKIAADVLQAARQKRADCLEAQIIDTRITQPLANAEQNEQGALIGGSWQESWLVNICGEEQEFMLEFWADKSSNLLYQLL